MLPTIRTPSHLESLPQFTVRDTIVLTTEYSTGACTPLSGKFRRIVCCLNASCAPCLLLQEIDSTVDRNCPVGERLTVVGGGVRVEGGEGHDVRIQYRQRGGLLMGRQQVPGSLSMPCAVCRWPCTTGLKLEEARQLRILADMHRDAKDPWEHRSGGRHFSLKTQSSWPAPVVGSGWLGMHAGCSAAFNRNHFPH